MALGLEPPLEDRDHTRRARQGGYEEIRPAERNGARVLAHGAMVCPACNLPLAPGRRVGVAEVLRCGFCDSEAPAREYLVPDVFDTVANEVYVTARI